MISHENLLLVSQLVMTLEQLSKRLEEFYSKRDMKNYESTKKEILNLQSKIYKTLK